MSATQRRVYVTALQDRIIRAEMRARCERGATEPPDLSGRW
jgi:hypothetical protein